MQQESAQELIERQGHQLLLVVVGGVAPTKGHVLVGRGDEPVVGDGDAMSVTTQILEHILGAAEGWFGETTQSLRNSGRSQAAKILGWASRVRSPAK